MSSEKLSRIAEPRQPDRGQPSQASRRRAVFTIVSSNYIGFAATLMQSVASHVLGAERFVILADTRADFSEVNLAATLLDCDQLGIELIGNMKAWYTVIEFNTAIKPYAFLHLFGTLGFDEVCYIDPDILLFSGMSEVFNALSDHSCVLTPHMMRPLQDGREPSDLTIMKSGIYNLGFLGLRNDEDGVALARWWADRCFRHCRVDIAGNMFTDQRWMDLAPVFVRRPFILRHPGYNVAYWNLAHRIVTRAPKGEWQVNGRRLVFFHFSGISPNVPGSFSKHQNRFTAENLGLVAELCDLYRHRVLANKWEAFSKRLYGFGAFADGRRIDDTMRHWLARAVEEGEIDPDTPIDVASDYYDRPDEAAAGRGAVLTRYMHQYWLDRADLRAAFDVFAPAGLKAYANWFFGGEAVRQHADPASVEAARALCQADAPADAPEAEQASPAGSGPPWPPVAEEIWAERSTDAFAGLAHDLVLASSGIAARIPKHIALAWERRQDLQNAFNVNDPAQRSEFLAWALTNGLREGAVDLACLPASFVEGFTRLSSLSAHYADVPITDGMILFRNVTTSRNPLPNWRNFPTERLGRLAHGLWFAFVAPRLFGWPDSFVAPVRAYFHAPSDLSLDGFTLNRAAATIWELRADLQEVFPPAEPGSVWKLLRWLMLNGLRDIGVSLDSLDPRLRAFLLSPSPRMEGATQLLEIVYSFRTDLQARYDLADPAQRALLLAWAARRLAHETRALPLGAALHPVPEAAPAAAALPVHRAALALTGAWSAASGRAEDLRSSARALTAAGFTDYVVIDLESGRALLPDGTELPTGTQIEAGTNIVHTNADTAMGDAVRLRRLGVRAARAIGFWAWELEWLPAYWRHAYNFYDAIWASTAFAEAAFLRDDARPVTLVPMAVSEPELDQAPGRAALGLPEAETLFLFMFDFRSYTARKNPGAVLRAFAEAFPKGGEPARLIIKTSGAAARPEEAAALAALADDPRIEIRDAQLARPDLLGLISAADAFVSLHRSEGFGRGPAEAMLLGTPVIVTDYSGSADYATAECALLVDHTLVPVGTEEYPGVTGQFWAEANVATAAAHMRWVHEHREEARALGERGRARIGQLYAPPVVGAAMLRALGLSEGAAEEGPGRRRAASAQKKES